MLLLPSLLLALPVAVPQATATQAVPARLDLIPAEALAVGWIEDVHRTIDDVRAHPFYRFAREHPEVLRELDLEPARELLDLFEPAPDEAQLARMGDEERLAHELLALSTGGASWYVQVVDDFDFVAGLVFEIEGSVPRAVELLSAYGSGAEGSDRLEFGQRGELLIGVTPEDERRPYGDRWSVIVGHDTLIWLFSETESLFQAEVERLALRLAGSPSDVPVLSESAILAESTGSLRTRGPVNGLINLGWPMRWLADTRDGGSSITLFEKNSPQERFVTQSGVLDMRWIRASIDPGSGTALDLELQIHVPTGSLLAVAADQFGPLPTDLLDRLPGDALSLLGVHYDIAGLLFGLYEALETLEGDLGQIVSDQLAIASEIAGVDLEEEFLAQFTGRVVRAVDPVTRAAGEDLERALRRDELPSTWAVEVRDAETVRISLEELGYRVDPDLEFESVDVGDLEVVQPVPNLVDRYWSVAGPLGRGYAVFGTTQTRTVGVLQAFLEPRAPEAGAEPLRAVYREFANASVVHTARLGDVLSAGFELWRSMNFRRPASPELEARQESALRAIQELHGTFAQIGDRVPAGLAYRLRLR